MHFRFLEQFLPFRCQVRGLFDQAQRFLRPATHSEQLGQERREVTLAHLPADREVIGKRRAGRVDPGFDIAGLAEAPAVCDGCDR